MTQENLGHVADIDSSNIRAYESGRAMPSIHTLLRIADAMRMPIDYFLKDLKLEMFPVNSSDRRRRAS